VKHRVWILAVVILVGSAAVVRAQARMDEASLTAAHEALVVGVKTANLTMLQAMIHPRGLGFFRESQLPIQLGADFTANNVLPAVVADLGRFMAVPTQTIYRVVGQVGVVMMTALLVAPKESKELLDRSSRATYVYVVDGGNWRLLSWHGSDLPVKPKPKK